MAISAAGVAWGIATACAQGWLDECKCINNMGEVKSRTTNQVRRMSEWDWGGLVLYNLKALMFIENV